MKPRYRISQWLDTSDENAESYPVVYGVQIYHSGKWRNCSEDGKPLFYSSAEGAQQKIKELKAEHVPANP